MGNVPTQQMSITFITIEYESQNCFFFTLLKLIISQVH